MSRLTRWAGCWLLAGTPWLVAPAVAAPAPDEVEEVVKDKDREAFVPTRKYQPLSGKVVGVLVGDVKDMVARDGRGGPADALGFSRGGGSYRWVYTPAEKGNAIIQGLQVPVGEDGGKTKVYPFLNMANPTTVKQWGITAPYTLVEMEVNDNLGSPAGESFVGTNMKALDGTREYPLEVNKVVGELKRRYETYQKDHQKEIDEALTQAQKDTLKDLKPTGPRETQQLLYVTWLPETKRLRVSFLTRISDGAWQEGRGIGGPGPFPLPPPPLPPGAGGKEAIARRPPPPPGGFGVRFGTGFGVEFGLAYDVSSEGIVDRTLKLPIKSFEVKIPPPSGIGGGPRDLPPAPAGKQ